MRYRVCWPFWWSVLSGVETELGGDGSASLMLIIFSAIDTFGLVSSLVELKLTKGRRLEYKLLGFSL